ncbi:MAG: response regulator [Pseudomonadota bacterium]
MMPSDSDHGSAPPARAREAGQGNSAGRIMEKRCSHRILIVDDDEVVGRSIAGILRRMTVKSVYAPDGDQASAARGFSVKQPGLEPAENRREP